MTEAVLRGLKNVADLGQFCLDHSDTFAAAVLTGGAAYFMFRLWPTWTVAIATATATVYLTETSLPFNRQTEP